MIGWRTCWCSNTWAHLHTWQSWLLLLLMINTTVVWRREKYRFLICNVDTHLLFHPGPDEASWITQLLQEYIQQSGKLVENYLMLDNGWTVGYCKSIPKEALIDKVSLLYNFRIQTKEYGTRTEHISFHVHQLFSHS